MFTIQTADGKKITGEDMHWHELPEDIVINELSASISVNLFIDDKVSSVVVANDSLVGFESYGFQMYDVSSTDQSSSSKGVQLIGICGDKAIVVDINLSSGKRETMWRQRQEMTYNASLLRPGCKLSSTGG